jgi:signal transduction histidine kinase
MPGNRVRAYPPPVDVPGYVLRLKRRWVASGLPDYPLWIAAVIDSAALVSGLLAVAQRGSEAVPLSVLLVAIAVFPWVIELWWQGRTWIAFLVLTGGATTTLMLWRPVEYDVTPLLLVLMAGHVTACAGVWRGLTAVVAGEAIVIGLGVHGTMPGPAVMIWAVSIVGAMDLGYVMRSQQLRIEDQQRQHAIRERQAVLEERQRIAREVHDLVAHSLSVTMLHLTAARRDLEDGGDTTEAVEALREAERVGRQAVSDVRRTVGLLGSGGAAEPPAPTVDDIATLVAEFRAAGMDVELVTHGDLSQVPPATGLGLYRVVQESLTNVARHSPQAAAAVTLDLLSDPGRLTVRNRLSEELVPGVGGHGLSGMAQRAKLLGATLSAGRQGSEWVVQVDLPRGDTARDRPGHVCPLPRLVRGLSRPVAPLETT